MGKDLKTRRWILINSIIIRAYLKVNVREWKFIEEKI